ncbi:polyprenyl synthetase family protein [Legionella sp. W05-934-2]|uniref:polyprenyl synthetase family protein n=1 Tax=Legionella sp. W05-934-2 TaxID=1198649 RepID=UPI003462DA0C
MMSDVIQTHLLKFEDYLKTVVHQKPIPSTRLKAAIEYSLLSGGKRFRPLLVYLTGELLHIDSKILNVIAAAVEMVHCYSLIHDDLPAMDDDDFRRGKPSCHKAFDQATAILAGDALSSWSIELLVTELSGHLPANTILLICKRLLKAIGVEGMISGQSLDLTVLASMAVTELELEAIHQLKTGFLIQACILMVADLIDLDDTKQQALQQFANKLGLVFQMQDDYLDYYAPLSTLGKMRSSDLANDKTTYAQLYDKNVLKDKINRLFRSCHESLLSFSDGKSALNNLVEWLQSRIE